MIRYDRLWETMKRKKISQYRLMKKYGFSSGQLSRLKKNMYVSTHTIEVLCTILNCPVEDVMEWQPEFDYAETLSKTQKKQNEPSSSSKSQKS